MTSTVEQAKREVETHAIEAWNSTARGLTRAARLVIAVLIFFLVVVSSALCSVDEWLESTPAKPEQVDELV